MELIYLWKQPRKVVEILCSGLSWAKYVSFLGSFVGYLIDEKPVKGEVSNGWYLL